MNPEEARLEAMKFAMGWATATGETDPAEIIAVAEMFAAFLIKQD